MLRFIAFFSTFFAYIFLSIGRAYAHEVYVLSPEEVQKGLDGGHSLDVFGVIAQFAPEFVFWTFVAILTITFVFFISISRRLENIIDPILFSLKKYWGLLIIRATLGLALILSGLNNALFGPELTLPYVFGDTWAPIIQWALIVAGICILTGFLNRSFALLTIGIYAFAIYTLQDYMLTYASYLGEMLVLLVLGEHVLSIDKHIINWHGASERVVRFIEKYAFLILRITFGISLIYASFYAKFLHSTLALETVVQYNLTAYFPFDPQFIVLGAFIIEALLGLFFIVGFEVRFAALFLSFFLVLSLIYFKEAVWPHVILFGTALGLFIHGYDRYTVEGRFFKDARHEPIL